MGNNGTVIGHPTIGPDGFAPGQGAAAGTAGNTRQALAAQAAWFVDPINGSNTQSGKTLGTAIRTRSEFYRRMAGVTLTQPVSVTITSDLLVTDTFRSRIYNGVFANTPLTFIGIPTILFTGVLTGVVNRNGATSTPTKLTIATLPVSWTASGLLNLIVEQVGGAVKSTVVSDLGAKQAWVSPPMTSAGAETTFTNGLAVNVYTLPNLGNEVADTVDYVAYQYLRATTWELYDGSAILTSCTGPGVIYQGSNTGIINHISGASRWVNLGGSLNVYGGNNIVIASGFPIRFNAAATVGARGLSVEMNGIIVSPGPSGTGADIEYLSTNAADALVYSDGVNGGDVDLVGFVYGTATGPLAVDLECTNVSVYFKQTPNITGATDIKFGFAGITSKLSYLTSAQVSDPIFNNKVIGTAGAVNLDRDERTNAYMTAQGLAGETFARQVAAAASLMVGGTVYYCAVGLKAGDLVTNVLTQIQVAGVAMTLSKLGLYDKAGNRLALSLDQGASWSVAGVYTVPMITPFRVLTTDLYYLAAVATGGTLPSLPRSSISAGVPVTGKSAPFGFQLAQIDLPSPGVISSGLVNAFSYWLGWS